MTARPANITEQDWAVCEAVAAYRADAADTANFPPLSDWTLNDYLAEKGLMVVPLSERENGGAGDIDALAEIWRICDGASYYSKSKLVGAIAAVVEARTKARAAAGNAGEKVEPRDITDADREYASELLADLANPDGLPRHEIAAQWFRKARVENAIARACFTLAMVD
jgi:hypothetical protein